MSPTEAARVAMAEAEAQLLEEQRSVDYDIKEFTVEILVLKFDNGDIFIPLYQRKLVWKTPRQSKFIESVLLGLPIPFLFCAEVEDARLEIVDGSQRIQTLTSFMRNRLLLADLEKLDLLNGYRYSDLPAAQQRRFRNRTIRMVALSEKADLGVRFDIFERINTGSLAVNPSELRKGAFSGPFYDLVVELAADPEFRALCPLSEESSRRAEGEELVLRYFAYSERYREFEHGVRSFLDSYVKRKNEQADTGVLQGDFRRMLAFVRRFFPGGFAKAPGSRSTPRVRFEAISVGTHLALKEEPSLVPKDMAWLESPEFRRHVTSGASNSRPRLVGRIEFVRDALLGR